MCNVSAFSQPKNEDDLKKRANVYFEDEDYDNAYKFYAQLVSLYPKDADYNYKLGVCMLFTEPDKKKPFSYLKQALKNPADAPKDATFYLGKTYHINYQFDEAIKYYNEFKKIGSSSSIKKLQVDREIEACKNGKRLLSNLSDLVIISKKQLNDADYFRSYDVKSIGGKLLIKPDDFKTSYDKKKKEKSVIYLPKTSDRVYYSSFGENGSKGRDLYYVNKLPNGGWSKPTAMPASINTDYDEDYPFLHPNGKILYFSSKGHNSMGGYDIFKTSFNEQTNTWSVPVNLEFPINSPDDDILFITDSLEKTAFFSTGRYSPFGKIDVLKINTERRPMNVAVIKGTVLKESADQSLKSKITVKSVANGEIVGTYQAQDNGDYYMEIPNGGKFLFTVETPGLPIQSDAVQVPIAYTLKPYKQAITYDSKKLKIINYFDSKTDDAESYALMIDLIEKKAKLEINETEPYNNGLKDASKNQNPNTDLNSVTTNNPTISSDDTKEQTTNTNKNVTNEQLINMAKTDAKESQQDATQLKKEATDAFGLATQKTAEAVEFQKQADDVLASANLISDTNKKNQEIAKANVLKDDAKSAQSIANLATNLAKKLEVDAQQKQKEADLTNQYITQLESVTKNKNNKDAIVKLEQIQKELDALSTQKNQSDDLFASIKAENELKQNELKKSDKKSKDILNEVKQLDNEVKELENDLANESDKSLKENISAQMRELKSEIEIKNKELATNDQKIDNLNNELIALNEELKTAGTILNEKTDDITFITPVSNKKTNTQPTNNAAADKNTQPNTDVKTNTNNTDNLNNEVANNNNVPANNTGKNNPPNTDIKTTTNTNNTDNLNNEAANNNISKPDDVANADANNVSDNNNSTNLPVITNPLSIDLLTNKYIDKINYDAIRDEDKNELITQNELLKEYNKEVVDLIALDKKELSATKDSELKKKLNQEIKSLENLKTDNNQVIAANAKKIKEIGEKPIVVNNTTNNQPDNTANPNATNNALSDANTSLPDNTNTNVNNNANGQTGSDLATQNAISADVDNATLTQNLAELKNSLSQSNSVLTINDDSQNNSAESKQLNQNYTEKFNELKQQQTIVADLISKTQLNAAKNNNSSQLEAKAEVLGKEAVELRKQSTTKSGSEKQQLVNQAIEKEAEAIKFKTEAAAVNEQQNVADYQTNADNLAELQKLSTSKSGNDVSQANLLADEANLNFKNAQKLREEANAYPNGFAKLGGLSNADEKEKEAIEKQNKAIALLAPLNPTYKPKTNQSNTDLTKDVAELNKAVNQSNILQSQTSTELSKVNQNQISELLATVNSADDATVVDLKNKANSKNTEAQNLITQSNSKTNNAEKASLLLDANKKEKEAIALLSEAKINADKSLLVAKTDGSNAIDDTTNNNVAVNSNNNNNNNGVGSTDQKNDTQPKIDANAPKENSDALANASEPKNTNANTNINPEITSLKNDLSNPTPALILNFDTYSSPDAISIKNQASQKLNAAINNDKSLEKLLDNLSQQTGSSSQGQVAITASSINDLVNQSDKLSADALALRRGSVAKTGQEKENDIAKAKELEGKAIAKKIEAANNQKQLNNATFNANALSLSELEKMAQGKNISELSSADMYTNEANLFLKQSKNIRLEADAYPSDAAKLGGYSNAEEKEQLAIAKQDALLTIYKKYFSNYVPKQPNVSQSKDGLASEFNTIKLKVDQNYEAHIDGLQVLSQANEKEYKARFLTIPQELNETEKANKAEAISNYKKGQDLLAQANQTSNLKQKKGLLIESNAAIQKSITQLNTIKSTPAATQNLANQKPTNTSDTQQNTNQQQTNNTANTTANQTNNQTATTNNRTNNAANNNNNQANSAPVKIKVEGLEVKNTAAYTARNPIPIDPKLPDGLIFKVQVGAFKSPLPDNTFKGLSPVIAQNTPSGYIRYMAGNFEKYESANAVKNDLRALGYSDAFVVVYFNGQRITISEAIAKLQASGQTNIQVAANTTAGLVNNANIPRNPFPVNTVSQPANVSTEQQSVVVANELEKINGLLYTVQIGVFSKQVTKEQLFNLSPIYTEQLPSGLYRYTAGIYNQKDRLLSDKKKVIDLGVKDAFVSAYYNSKKTTFAEAEKLQAENVSLKLETQNPIVFSNATPSDITQTTNDVTPNNVTSNIPQATTPQTNANAFSNGVTSGPAATANNGVKYDEAGITFKVQIGAYKNQVPNDVASKFLSIKTWPVSNVIVNGLFIYTIGSFNAVSFAKQLKAEAVSVGINDAFITVYKDGKKLYGAEATQYLNQ